MMTLLGIWMPIPSFNISKPLLDVMHPNTFRAHYQLSFALNSFFSLSFLYSGCGNFHSILNATLVLNVTFRSVYIVYTVLGDVCVYVVGKDEYDELACKYWKSTFLSVLSGVGPSGNLTRIYKFYCTQVAEVIFVITSSVKDVCGKPPTERLFLDKYGKICLCLDEIVWKVT